MTSCCCATAGSRAESRCRRRFEALGEITDGHIHEALCRQPQEPARTAFHHHFAVVAEAAGQQFGEHPKAAPAGFGFLDQAAAGGPGEGPAGGRHPFGEGEVAAAGPLLAGRGDACFQLRAHQVEQRSQHARLGWCCRTKGNEHRRQQRA